MPLETDTPLWRFSLAVYGGAGVSAACLAVQDRLGGDVNLLLCCAWLGAARGVRLEEAALAVLEGAIAEWNEVAVRPLRGVRRAVKPLARDAEVADFRKEVAALELRAEQIAQAMLYARCDAAAGGCGSAEIAAANVALYMARIERAAGKPGVAVDMTGLIDAASRQART